MNGQLLRAIRENENLTDIRIVLGPNKSHPDVSRLVAMLEHALGHRRHEVNITVEPMWSQDFLTVWNADDWL